MHGVGGADLADGPDVVLGAEVEVLVFGLGGGAGGLCGCGFELDAASEGVVDVVTVWQSLDASQANGVRSSRYRSGRSLFVSINLSSSGGSSRSRTCSCGWMIENGTESDDCVDMLLATSGSVALN